MRCQNGKVYTCTKKQNGNFILTATALTYTGLVLLPKLDYCGAVWDPHHHSNIEKLVGVQKFAGKIITKQWKAEYLNLLATLNWQPLSSRRKNQILKVCSNILNLIIYLYVISPNVFTLQPHPSLIIKLFLNLLLKTLAHRHPLV